MVVVLNEREYAEDLLREDVTWRTAGHALHYIAKLYFSKGYQKEQVKEKLDDFLLSHMDGYNRVLDEDLIQQAIALSKGKQLVELDGVIITKAEIEKIQALDGKPMQRLMLTLLCLAKYHVAINEKNSYWVTEDTRDIFRMANVSANVKKQNEMICELHNLGYVGFASLKKIDNLNIHVLIAEEDYPQELFVDDFENIGLEWNQYCGKPYIKCECCGKKVVRTGRRQKYCRKCAKSINIEKTAQNRKMFDLCTA